MTDDSVSREATLTHTHRFQEPCQRCGVAVLIERSTPSSVAASDQSPTFCAACRAIESKRAKTPDAAPPIDLVVQEVLTVSCQLCHSQLMVPPSKIGTQVTCPDCHSTLTVTDANSRLSQQHRSAGQEAGEVFDPDAPLTIQAAAKRPPVYADLTEATAADQNDQVDPSVGLDPVTDDLLSQPLPDSPDAHADLDDRLPTEQRSEPLRSRREKPQRVQKRALSPNRQQLRKQARQRKASQRAELEGSDDRLTRSSNRRTRTRDRNHAHQSSFVSDALEWLKQPALLMLWLIATALLSFVYFTPSQWGPLQIFERYFTAVAAAQPLPARLLVKTAAVVLGGGLVYWIAGRVFAQRAFGSLEDATDEETRPKKPSGLMTMIQFAVAWLLSGLPFLWLSILLLPLQIAFFPVLLIGLWHNRSIWKVVAAEPFTLTGSPNQSNADLTARTSGQPKRLNRPRWPRTKPVFRHTVAAAAIGCGSTAMIFSGGLLTVPGWLLTTGLMIGIAGICGGHCRELAQRLEPNE